MSFAMVVLLLLAGAITVAVVLSSFREEHRWVAFSWGAGHRMEELVRVSSLLRRAGVRYRLRNAVSVGSEGTMGAGMSTTLLVLREDLVAARKALVDQTAKR